MEISNQVTHYHPSATCVRLCSLAFNENGETGKDTAFRGEVAYA